MSPRVILVSLAAMVLAILATGYLYATSQQPSATRTNDSPRAEVQETFINLGVIKVSETRQQDFSLKNSGPKPLQILGVSSSCGCTAGSIIYQGQTSREYSMHDKGGYVTEIAPGDSAIVRLTYRPATMPVFGLVEREVYVSTNDPEMKKIVFGIKATVN